MGLITVTVINNGDSLDASPIDVNFNTIVNAFNGNIDNSNLSASAGIIPSKFAINAAVIPLAGAVLPAGKITLQCQTVTITALANTSTAGAANWATPFTTLISAWASIQSNATNNGTFVNAVQGSNTTQGNAIVWNVTGSNNAVTVHIFGLGII